MIMKQMQCSADTTNCNNQHDNEQGPLIIILSGREVPEHQWTTGNQATELMALGVKSSKFQRVIRCTHHKPYVIYAIQLDFGSYANVLGCYVSHSALLITHQKHEELKYERHLRSNKHGLADPANSTRNREK
jgi:hypothetical protein